MKRLTLAAAAAAILVAAPAFANSTASASLGPITVTLTDLTPADGGTPWITFAPPSSYAPEHNWYTDATFAKAAVFQSQMGDTLDVTNYGTATWGLVSAAANKPLAWANASLTGSTNAVLAASGGATTPVSANSSDNAQYTAQTMAPTYYGYFTLSANTSVTFSGQAAISGWAQAGSSINPDYAEADARISVEGPNALGSGGLQSINDMIANDVQPYPGQGLESFNDSRILTASFDNRTNGALDGTLRTYVAVYGYSYAGAVPEPETYAMLLVGLGLLGFVARRRKQNAAA